MPAIILTAVPEPRPELPELFTSRDSELVQVLQEPAQFRRMGSGKSSIVRGELRRYVRHELSLPEVWRDGVALQTAVLTQSSSVGLIEIPIGTSLIHLP